MPRMKPDTRLSRCIAALCLGGLACLTFAGGCQREGRETELNIVTSTTMLGSIVREIGGDRVKTTSIVPYDALPENFEPGPGQIDAASRADLVIMSGYEKWAPRMSAAVKTQENLAFTGIAADLMLPYYHLDAADSVTEALVRRDPEAEVLYRFNRNDYRSRLALEAEDLCASMLRLDEARVICADAQAGFLDYMGFDIIGTYGSPDDLTRGETARLIEVGERNGVRLVVDDFHRGPDAGERIADEIGATRVVLKRYPESQSYIELLRESAEKLLAALQ